MSSISNVGPNAPSPKAAPGNPGMDPLSYAAPDVKRGAPRLSTLPTLGLSTLAGVGASLGAMLLGRGSGSAGRTALRGGVLGAGLGAILLAADRATGGKVKGAVNFATRDRRHQLLFVLKNPTRPWIAPMGMDVARDARSLQYELYGRTEPKDGPQDAFRHGYASALFALRAMRDHDVDVEQAHRLSLEAGDANEADGQDDNDSYSREMDFANNRVGIDVLGDGRAVPGEDATPDGYVTEAALRQRILGALAGGRMQLVERGTATPTVRSSNELDLPTA